MQGIVIQIQEQTIGHIVHLRRVPDNQKKMTPDDRISTMTPYCESNYIER